MFFNKQTWQFSTLQFYVLSNDTLQRAVVEQKDKFSVEHLVQDVHMYLRIITMACLPSEAMGLTGTKFI